MNVKLKLQAEDRKQTNKQKNKEQCFKKLKICNGCQSFQFNSMHICKIGTGRPEVTFITHV